MYSKSLETTISAPCWSSVMTGLSEEEHEIHHNEVEDYNIIYSTNFINKIREVNGITSYGIASSWRPMCQIMLRSVDDHIFYDEESVLESDRKVNNKLIDILNQEICPDIIIPYFNNVDMVGHEYGFSINSKHYIDAIEEFDNMFGDIIETINKRLDAKKWLIIIVTDHGGVSLNDLSAKESIQYGESTGCQNVVGGHGMSLLQMQNIFIIVNGIDFKNHYELFPQPTLLDICPTILFHYSLYNRNLNGRSLQLIK